MAKGRVGVLEAHEAPDSSAPQTHCGRAIAERLVASREARRLSKRLIQMCVRVKASEAIKQAKAARDVVEKAIQKEIERMRIVLIDGGPGIGNLIPFASLHNQGDKLHYEMPRAGDVGMRRFNLYHRRDDAGAIRIHSREIHVSSRSLFSRQPIPAVRLAV
jgi:hypothetical protein